MSKKFAPTKKEYTLSDVMQAITGLSNRVTALESPAIPEVKTGKDKKLERQANKILRKNGVTPQQLRTGSTPPPSPKTPEIPDNELMLTCYFVAGRYTYFGTSGKPSEAVRTILTNNGWGYKASFDSTKHESLAAFAEYNGQHLRYTARVVTLDELLSTLKATCPMIDKNVE
jgi:hypothetical protein